MSSSNAIKATKISKCFHIYDKPIDRLKQFILPNFSRGVKRENKKYYREFWALKELSFEIDKGEAIGIIGRNGSGKSTLLQIICGTLSPSGGVVKTSGVTSALLELGSGFNPEFTGKQNVFMNASLLGLTNRQIRERYDEIIDFADIGSFVDEPLKSYSSGMMVRLAFAVAINVNPEILVVDEALAVGDAAFQRKCIRKIEELRNSGMTLLFVSHDTETVKKLCNRALYLSHGELIEFGETKHACIAYERDLFGGLNEPGAVTSPISSDYSQETAILDPELTGNSAKYYGDGSAAISDIKITNKNDRSVNVLEEGIDFKISYRVDFLQDVQSPIFGMMITNREGNCIFGVNSSKREISRRNYKTSECLYISFSLKNNLVSGIYYLTCGVHSGNKTGEVFYHQRCIDVLIFKIVASETEQIGGVANLYAEINYSGLGND